MGILGVLHVKIRLPVFRIHLLCSDHKLIIEIIMELGRDQDGGSLRIA